VPGGAQLADHEHVQRRTQLPGNLGRHRYPAARQPEDDARTALEMAQPSGQDPPRFQPVGEPTLRHTRPPDAGNR
jgi:hypothetical protein